MDVAPMQPVPVFPLPDLVVFPCAVAPIYVDQVRHRTLVRDALRADRLVVFALIAPGWEPGDEASPTLHPVACLARVEEATWRPDDCYDLWITGLSRVRIGRVTREYPYRAARVALAPQDPISDDDPLVQIEWGALKEAYERISPKRIDVSALSEARPDPAPATSFEGFVNGVCTEMAMRAAEKHSLLELDSVLERARRVREWIERDLRNPRRLGTGDRN